MITKFLKDNQELEAFITGGAGTGKTTALIDIVGTLIEKKVNFLVCAYTHKAKDVLISKLPVLKDDYIVTLHSFLKKRPTINAKATNINTLLTSRQYGTPEPLELLIIDEFSFVGEKDYLSLGDLQVATYSCKECGAELEEVEITSYDNEGRPLSAICEECDTTVRVDTTRQKLKILYVGDTNQLNPVKDIQAIVPHEPYWTKLTKVHRQGVDNDLHITLEKLVGMIEHGNPVETLVETKDFVRNVDIDELYKTDKTESKIMLAFTNKAVQQHNATIQGRHKPAVGDKVAISTLKRTAVIEGEVPDLPYGKQLVVPVRPGFIDHNTKFNPVKTLQSYVDADKLTYYVLDTHEIVPAIFGVYNNKLIRDKIARTLTDLNKENKNSKQAFKVYKTISDYVSIMEFIHCMTIHKSQGSEYDHVYIDYQDLKDNCINSNDVIRLLYVGISRAKFKVFLN
jgi:hypothetical protein